MRFPEFNGEYEKHTLGEMGNGIIGLTYSPKNVVNEGGKIVFRSSNIQDGLIDYSDIVRVDMKIKESILTQKDDLLICARNGSPRLIGKNALLTEKEEGQTFGAFMLVYRSNDNSYIHKLLNTKRYTTQVGENLGARINQITSANLGNFEFYFPQTNEERNKIANFLNLIDRRIATQIRVIDKLESLIKGISEKLFADVHGVHIPLERLCTIQKGQQVNREKLSEIGNYYVMNGGITPSGYYENYNTQADTISISEGGNSCGYVQFNDSCFWSGGHCYTLLDIQNEVTNLYLFHYLKYKEQDIMAMRIGGGLPNIQKKDLSKFSVLVLPKEMQQQITSLLQLVTKKVKVEKDYLANLSQQKSYLLQNMFI